MPCLRADGQRLLLQVTARPGASRSAIQGLHGVALKVAVQAPPEKGKANKALCAFLAKSFGLRKAQVSLAQGPTSREKTVALDGLTLEVAQDRLRELLGD